MNVIISFSWLMRGLCRLPWVNRITTWNSFCRDYFHKIKFQSHFHTHSLRLRICTFSIRIHSHIHTFTFTYSNSHTHTHTYIHDGGRFKCIHHSPKSVRYINDNLLTRGRALQKGKISLMWFYLDWNSPEMFFKQCRISPQFLN